MKKTKKIWQQPWAYKEGFIIALSLLLLGIAMQYSYSSKLPLLSYPTNIIVGGLFLVMLIVVYILFRNKHLVQWLSSVPAAISAISLYLSLVVLMGIIPQENSITDILAHTGLRNITQSYAFAFAHCYFLSTLAMVTLQRTFPFKAKNIGFVINHLGLWMTVFAVGIGAGDIQKVRITINKDKAVFEGTNQHKQKIPDLGIAIQLNEFYIDEFTPKGFIIDDKTGNPIHSAPFYLDKGNTTTMQNWKIEVLDFHRLAVNTGSGFHPVYDEGAAPAALIKAIDTQTGTTFEGWISCGSFRYPGDFVELNNKQLFVMAEAEPRKFSSAIKIYAPNTSPIDTIIEVNKPVKAGVWNIYQLDYDKDKGRWSDVSELELVYDPWLPLVYFGIFFMMAGAVYIFWIGKF